MPRRCLFSMLALSLFLGNSNALTSFELHNINEAHKQGFTGEGVKIGVVDGIFYPEHELLRGKFLEPPIHNQYSTDLFHGNHVAGIAAANKTNNESYGVATKAMILGYGNLGNGVTPEEFKKILNYNVKIVNNSHTADRMELQEFAKNNDVLIVYANGNGNTLSPTLAARQGTGSDKNLGAWLTVGNINSTWVSRQNGKLIVDSWAVKTNSQLCVNASAYCVMAAGTGIQSAGEGNSGIREETGTSMAAPLVTGVAALVAQKYPFLGGKQLADVILSTANRDFEMPQVIYKNSNTSGRYEVVFIDTAIPTTEAEKLAAIQKVYSSFTEEMLQKSNFSTKTKEDVYGQGIVDAEKALKGLALLDINRLSAKDVSGNTAFYTINTNGHSALFENDLNERQWDDKYHIVNITAAKQTLKAALEHKNAGLKKTGLGTLSLSGDLNYKGDTNIEGGTLALVRPTNTVQSRSTLLRNAAAISLHGNVNVGSAGTLDISREANLQQNLNNSGTTNINAETNIANNFENKGTANVNAKLTAQNLTNSGTTNIDAATNVAQDVNNKGTLNVGITAPHTLNVSGKYTQEQNATLQLGFLVDNSSNSKLKAQTYDVKGGSLLYAPLSASVANRTITFDLQGLENHLGNFTNIALTSNGYAITYALLSGQNGITITARPNVYADFSGANPSLASVLRAMSSANISNDYNTFFSTLNAADFATYRSALVDLNDLSHLQYNNLLLGIQNQDILDKVINLQTEAEGVFLRPRYAHLKAGLKAHRAGFEFYANKNTTIGGFSSFINYDNLSGSDVSSQLVSLGLALRNTTALPIGIFGGARLGFANNTVKKTQSLKYKTQSASLFAGIDKDFEFAGEVHFIPTFYVNYHYFHQENFHHAGISYRGTAFFNRLQTNGFNGNNLFARNIHAKNTNFASANLGLTFKQNLAQFWNLGIHGFYERRLLGDKFKTSAQLSDFGGDFEQTLQISQNFFRFGFNLNYELPMNAKGIGYFASVGVDYETSSNGIDRYRAYGADFKGGIKF